MATHASQLAHVPSPTFPPPVSASSEGTATERPSRPGIAPPLHAPGAMTFLNRPADGGARHRGFTIVGVGGYTAPTARFSSLTCDANDLAAARHGVRHRRRPGRERRGDARR